MDTYVVHHVCKHATSRITNFQIDMGGMSCTTGCILFAKFTRSQLHRLFTAECLRYARRAVWLHSKGAKKSKASCLGVEIIQVYALSDTSPRKHPQLNPGPFAVLGSAQTMRD